MTMTTMTSDRQQTTQQDTADLAIAEAEAALHAARGTASQLRFNAGVWPAHRRTAIEEGDGQKVVAVRKLMAEAEDLATCAEIRAAHAEVALARAKLDAHNAAAWTNAARLMAFAKQQEEAAEDSGDSAALSNARTRRYAAGDGVGAALKRQGELQGVVSDAVKRARTLVSEAVARLEKEV